MKKVLVLYRELAGYFLACLEEFCLEQNAIADVVAYPIHSDAPFHFQHSDRIRIHSRHSLSNDELVSMIKNNGYHVVFTGGWFDKGYLHALRAKQCPAVLAFDNAWRGTFKQQLSVLYGEYFIRPLFNFAFVPGKKQVQLARKLGFHEQQILTGVYACDYHRFSSIILQPQAKRRLVFTGRYSDEKFVTALFNAFHELTEKRFTQWELHCIGTGPLWNKRKQSTRIFHHGFMQPDDLLKFMPTGSAFVLPSTFEPWGVVVHEFAAAGYPMVLSNAVGAGEAFLQPGKNGYLFESGNIDSLRNALEQIMSHSDSELHEMGFHSRKLAAQITPKTWASQLAFAMG
jgi:glycosyltransferase involved in cell wall biosynthesis